MLDKFPPLNPTPDDLNTFAKAMYAANGAHDVISELLFYDLAKFIAVLKVSQIDPNWVAHAMLIVSEWYVTNIDPMPTEIFIGELLGKYDATAELLVDCLAMHGLVKVSEGSFNDIVLRFVHMHNVTYPTNPYRDNELAIEARIQALKHE